MAILEATTKYGKVSGEPASNQAITIFKGIPYAAPPVGDLRWKAPKPPKPWEGTRECLKFPNICYQERRESEGGDDVIGNEFYCIEYPISEDCLYLNVWTPAKSVDEKLPVGVYLHGGGFAQGYGFLNCYDGEGFAKRGCVFVTLNHRLGVLGYLAHPWLTAEDKHHSSGNYGTMDIIAALRWINENISAFGGDPDKVTVFGQSGGGSKTLSMIATPHTNGLFRGAIMQSGGGIDRTMHDDIPLEQAEDIGTKFFNFIGIKSLEEARSKSPEELLKAVSEYNHGDKWASMDMFTPTIDGYILPDDCAEMVLNGQVPDINVMLGSTAGEFVLPDADLPSRETLLAEASSTYGEEHAEEYLSALHFDKSPEKALNIYREQALMGSAAHAATIAWCENQLRLNRKPSYQYYITLVPPGATCAHHSVEHHYVFQTLVRSNRDYTGKDWDLSNTLANYWANFIKTGSPNGTNIPEWTPYTADKKETLGIDYDLHMEKLDPIDLTKFNVKFDLKDL